ncbi:prephenate dehydrogenase [Thauera linaloolentis]|uniref:Prephenate dehydrogenase n=1 Tax=Thauera linaloolentis (strain DSM 12138 / JCM 21573 / CCUG 41526 / CIP 105981 / IAM 15112 / NBRC 102519 / 47Lol) TaxID=1123367 RepID=N6Z6Y9_THAL4|nr:prephenate dehydrogenase/arogenate dehydrogenase family protein [Thauera linaloolentis]ENO90138.1 prephenate dehydrogenase [Thauera linaloolentis 47Lol = DSM 12138]MCM8564724.1 prephenate dehydrogenase/arogenate dehydrogenase family protein [Thauera linaloolentis]
MAGGTAPPLIGRLVICGVGLIGGSFALGLRCAGAVGRIVGIGRRREPLERARELGVIDEIASDWAEALAGADLVLLAAPVGQMDAIMAAMAPHLGAETVVTDVGSTKRDVIDAVHRHLGRNLPQVVPAHPIAGAEKSGVDAAFADLYVKRKVVLTPLAESRADAVETVRTAWQACGATVVDMTPQEHDGVFAAVSHLPHLLAFGLVDDLARRDNAQLLFSHAASGFRDFTRIAGSHPEMWRDICVANRVALLAELDAYLGELAGLRSMLAAGDGDALEAVFERARRARNAWAEGLPVQTAE